MLGGDKAQGNVSNEFQFFGCEQLTFFQGEHAPYRDSISVMKRVANQKKQCNASTTNAKGKAFCVNQEKRKAEELLFSAALS